MQLLTLDRPQDGFSQANRITFPTLCKFKDLLADGICLELVAIAQAQRTTDIGISSRHRSDQFGFEGPIFKQAIDGHRWRCPPLLQTFRPVARCTELPENRTRSIGAGYNGDMALTRSPAKLAHGGDGASVCRLPLCS